MSIIYKCDRCNKMETKPLCLVRFPVLPASYSYIEMNELNTYPKDLCLSCIKELTEWVKVLPSMKIK